jgi:hypothetical protein
MTTDLDLDRVLDAFVARDLIALAASSGLPAELPLSTVVEHLHGDRDAYVRFFLGDPPREAFWTPAPVAGFAAVKIWFRDETVVKLHGEWPQLDVTAAAVLGTPDDRLDEQQEDVWAGRGIALATDEPGEIVRSLSLFAPTTPATYGQTLASVIEYREWE